MTKALKALAIAGALAGTTAATAYANSHGGYPAYPHAYSAQIDHQINSAIVGARGNGFDRLVFNHRDQMYTGGREVTFVVLLHAGADYRLAARCGADCVDVNLSLRDARGRELAADRSGEHLPGFNFRAPYSGAYVVTLELASCRSARCEVGAVVLGRGTPSPDA